MFCQLEKRIPKEKIVHKKSSTTTGFTYANRMPNSNFITHPEENNNFQDIPSTNASVIQRATFINYNNYTPQNDLQLNSQIVGVGHFRVGLRPGERANAAVFGPGGLICNHHAPYFRVSNAIINNWLIGNTVGNAINGINGVIAQLNNVGNGFAPIPPIQFDNFDLIMSQEFDDAIANIANDPRNLFYSPFHRGDAGGTQLDWPTNAARNNLAVGHIMFQYSTILTNNNMY